MSEKKLILLTAWGQAHLDPAPSLWTLRAMARAGKIQPQPVKKGRAYYVQADAWVVGCEPPSGLEQAASAAFHASKRRSAMLQRTPSWANVDAIRNVYREAQRITAETGVPHHVDHDIPLQGELVSGLHVHYNLRILTGAENVRKHNSFAIE